MLDRTAILADADRRATVQRHLRAEAERRAQGRQVIRALVANEMGRRAEFARLFVDRDAAERSLAYARQLVASLTPRPAAGKAFSPL